LKKIILLILLTAAANAQDFEGVRTFGNFRNAHAFYINSAGFIFVTDLNEHKVYKLDTLGNVLKETGGYGWNEEAFDEPVDIYATPLNVYVTDKNNHRVQWFDKDLNFISLLQTRNNRNEEVRFGYPLSAAVSGQGDLYILDQENNRILKFDLFGNFITEFGGLDAGKFRISKPVEFAVLDNTTYVLDTRGRRVVVFDQFGNGLNTIKLDNRMDNISASEGVVLLSSKSEIYRLDIAVGELIKINIDNPSKEDIRDVYLFHKNLFILTPKRIIILPQL
jgi:DNA-binding beta-propeller fold protein YncE